MSPHETCRRQRNPRYRLPPRGQPVPESSARGEPGAARAPRARTLGPGRNGGHPDARERKAGRPGRRSRDEVVGTGPPLRSRRGLDPRARRARAPRRRRSCQRRPRRPAASPWTITERVCGAGLDAERVASLTVPLDACHRPRPRVVGAPTSRRRRVAAAATADRRRLGQRAAAAARTTAGTSSSHARHSASANTTRCRLPPRSDDVTKAPSGAVSDQAGSGCQSGARRPDG